MEHFMMKYGAYFIFQTEMMVLAQRPGIHPSAELE